jgi:16S rRNA (guanine527-N7)-methyltransferase
LIEPVAAARYLSKDSPVWFDLGSGGGSPAIPLKLARPGGQLTMVESRERKAAFLREAVRALGILNTTVEAARIESVAAIPRLAGTADLITVRAVRIDPALVEAIRTLLRFGGQVVLFGTKRDEFPVPMGFEVAEIDSEASGDLARTLIVLNRAVTGVRQAQQ